MRPKEATSSILSISFTKYATTKLPFSSQKVIPAILPVLLFILPPLPTTIFVHNVPAIVMYVKIIIYAQNAQIGST